MRALKKLLKISLAWMIGAVIARPRLKLMVRTMLVRWPLLARMTRRLSMQSSFVPDAPRAERARKGPMSARSARIYRNLRKENTLRSR